MSDIRMSKVVLAAGRLTSSAIDIALAVYLFTLIISYNTGIGQGICAMTVGLIANAYDLAALFDPTEFVSETPMVTLGDGIAAVIGIASVVPLALDDVPPKGAPWAQDWSRSYGLLIVFIILHAIIGAGRMTMFMRDAKKLKEMKKHADAELVSEAGDGRSIELNETHAPA